MRSANYFKRRKKKGQIYLYIFFSSLSRETKKKGVIRKFIYRLLDLPDRRDRSNVFQEENPNVKLQSLLRLPFSQSLCQTILFFGNDQKTILLLISATLTSLKKNFQHLKKFELSCIDYDDKLQGVKSDFVVDDGSQSM